MGMGFVQSRTDPSIRPIVIEIQTGFPIPMSGVYQSEVGHQQRIDAGTRAPADLDGNPTRWSFVRT